MKRPNPVWEFEYSSSRRKHNHRCFCCKKIIKEGQKVLMCRVSGGKTKVSCFEHIEDRYVPDQEGTVRDCMTIWGFEALKKLGWMVRDEEIEPYLIKFKAP